MIMSNSNTNLVGLDDDHESIVDPNTSKLPECHNNDNNGNMTASPEALAEGISKILAGVIKGFNSKAEDASRSQDTLLSALDRLTSELDQLLEDAPLPFIMQHATKLSNVRKRVSSLNSLLKSVQHRLDNIDRMVSICSLDNKSDIEGSK